MRPRVASIENLIATDPGRRKVFNLVVPNQLWLAAQSLQLARRVGIVSGFYVWEARAGETDGPPGAKVLGATLEQLGIAVDYLTDTFNAPIFRALGLEAMIDCADYIRDAGPTHLLSIERCGRGRDGRYRNMRGVDISDTTAPLDDLFLEASRQGITTIGIGDGGNEIGMGKVFASALDIIDNGLDIATTVCTDYCIAAGVSNWGAFGLAGALSVLSERDLLPAATEIVTDIERVVHDAGGVDGLTMRHEPTVDGLDASHSVRMLEEIRRQIRPSPFAREGPLSVGILGFGETGRAAADLLASRGHRVRVSDQRDLKLDPTEAIEAVETGGHTIDFLGECDQVVASPGVRPDAAILDQLHQRGVPVASELELAYQLGSARVIAVTGTVGKRSTVELMQRLFCSAGRTLAIGGNRGKPLSSLLLEHPSCNPLAVAVSSFQLEKIVHFCPHIAVMLNIDEAHLDRHDSLAEYARIKSRIFMNHQPDDMLVLNHDDVRLRSLATKHAGRTFFTSTAHEVERGVWLVDGGIHLNVDGRVEVAGVAEGSFPANLLAAVLVCRLCDIPTGAIARAVQELSDEAPTQNRECGRPSPASGVSRVASTDSADHSRLSGRDIRALCRSGDFDGPTAGVALGYAQANLVVLPAEQAREFETFCRLNPKPCPLLEIAKPGQYAPVVMAAGADLRTDLPRYRVYRGGKHIDSPTSIESLWEADFVALLIGCSFTFESALLKAGVPVRHIEQQCNVPMYRTNRSCKSAGSFSAPLVVSMRPMTPQQADVARRVTLPYGLDHGAPVHTGDPRALGIGKLNQPDYGDAVAIKPGEIPVFWACGVTPIEAIIRAKLALAITHEPGHMFVTDVSNESLCASGFEK